MDVEDQDRELAAAIEASLRSQTANGREANEDELLRMAIEQSRLEEEARQRGEAVPGGGADGHDDIDAAEAVVDEDASGRDAALAAMGAYPGFGGAEPPFPPFGGDRLDPFGDGVGTEEGLGGFGLQGGPAADEDMPDAQLAAAIEASYAAQTDAGRNQSEDDLIAQAIQMSQKEEESRQRANLMEQQELELQESMLMDRMRQEEDERLRREEEERRQREIHERETAQAAAAAELEAKRGRVPPEPSAGEPGRLVAQIRFPDGRRLRRAFRGSDTVGQVYDYTDVEGGEAMVGVRYRLVENMPRRMYEDRAQTLHEAGLSGQCALLIETM